MRNVFYSFHYSNDAWRASQVRNMGVITGNSPCSDNDWESIKRGGDKAIERWIEGQMDGRTCTVVLVGENTADRKWIDYEIKRTWERGKGLVAVRIHGLKNSAGQQSNAGRNPLLGFTLSDGRDLSGVAKIYDTPYVTSEHVYNYIHNNLAAWVEEAIAIRTRN